MGENYKVFCRVHKGGYLAPAGPDKAALTTHVYIGGETKKLMLDDKEARSVRSLLRKFIDPRKDGPNPYCFFEMVVGDYPSCAPINTIRCIQDSRDAAALADLGRRNVFINVYVTQGDASD